MPVDTSIPLSVKTPTVADLLNTAGAYQNFRSGQIDLAGKEAANKVNPNDYTNEQGQLDTTGYNKSMNDALYSAGAGSQASLYQQQRMVAEATNAHAKKAQFDLHNMGMQQNRQDFQNLLAKDDLSDKDVQSTLDEMKDQGRIDPEHYNQATQSLQQAGSDPIKIKYLVTQALGQNYSAEMRLPQYGWETDKDGYKYLAQINPNAIDAQSGVQGVQRVSRAIPSGALVEYTDSNNIKHVLPEMEYRAMVNAQAQAGHPGMQISASPTTAQNIALGGQEQNSNLASAKQSYAQLQPAQDARKIIVEHAGDLGLWGKVDYVTKLQNLAAALNIPYTNQLTTENELMARGVNPHATTAQAAINNIDQTIGTKYHDIKKQEAQDAYLASGHAVNDLPKFQSDWLKNASIEASIYKKIPSPQERTNYLKSLNPATQKKVLQHINYLNGLGVEP